MREIKEFNGTEDNYSEFFSEPLDPSGFWLDILYTVDFEDYNSLR